MSRVPSLAAVLVVAGLGAAGSACRVSSVRPITVPATYQPEGEAANIAAAESCMVVGPLTVRDERPSNGVVGARTIQEREGRANITMGGDAEQWVRSAVERALTVANIRRATAPATALTVRLATVSVNEVAFRNSEYEARVVLDVDLSGPGSGSSVWSYRATARRRTTAGPAIS